MTPPTPLQRVRRQLAYYLLLFVEGDHGWGTVRMLAAIFGILVFVVVARQLQNQPPMTFLAALDLPPAFLPLAEFLASFVMPHTWRHIFAPILGFTASLLMGARYLQDLLELPSFSQAWNFLTTTVFGGAYPSLTVNEGRASVDDPERNPLLRFGGPGWAEIQLGSAALFERGAGPSAVRGAGTFFIRRWEVLRETFDLREIERSKTDVSVYTKDGIPLQLDEVRARFRLRSRGKRTEAEPYPVLVSAVRRAAYGRKVSDRGIDNWTDMVTGAVVGTITSWIGKRRMDELIPPPAQPEEVGGEDAEPRVSYRQSLHLLFQQGDTRRKFAEMGAEVLWVSVGHLRPDPNFDPEANTNDDTQGRDRIHGQMIDTWKSASQALILEEQADTQGYAEWLSDTARVQAQVEMIQTLTRGLRQAHDEGVPIADLITARGVEYLGSMGDTATLHRLADTQPKTGLPPEQVLKMLDEGKTGKSSGD